MEDSTIFFIIIIIIVVIVIFVLLFLFRGRPSQQQQPLQQQPPQPQQNNTVLQCVNNAHCSSPMVCDTASNTCKMPPGRPCASDNDCVSNSRCNGGICLARLLPSNIPDQQETIINPVPVTPPNMGIVQFTYVNEYYTLDTSESTAEDTQDTITKTTEISDTCQTTHSYSTKQETHESEGSVYTSTKTSNIIDVVAIDETTYKFYTNKMIHSTTDEDDSKFISSNRQISCADYWNGSIYAVDEKGSLVKLTNNSIGKLKWDWEEILSIEDNLIHLSSTYDGKFLWVQTETKAYLYNRNYELVESFSIRKEIRRRYGNDKNHFVDLNIYKNVAQIQIGDQQQAIDKVKDICLDGYNNIRIIKISDDKERIKYCSGKTLAW